MIISRHNSCEALSAAQSLKLVVSDARPRAEVTLLFYCWFFICLLTTWTKYLLLGSRSAKKYTTIHKERARAEDETEKRSTSLKYTELNEQTQLTLEGASGPCKKKKKLFFNIMSHLLLQQPNPSQAGRIIGSSPERVREGWTDLYPETFLSFKAATEGKDSIKKHPYKLLLHTITCLWPEKKHNITSAAHFLARSSSAVHFYCLLRVMAVKASQDRKRAAFLLTSLQFEL